MRRRFTSIPLLLVVVSGCSQAPMLDVTGEELRPAVVMWVNGTGLVEDDPAVWRQLLTEACDQGVWEDGVAERLANRYVDEDLDVAMEGVSDGPELLERAAQTLWIMSVQVCGDEFPEGEIDEGPPGF